MELLRIDLGDSVVEESRKGRRAGGVEHYVGCTRGRKESGTLWGVFKTESRVESSHAI